MPLISAKIIQDFFTDKQKTALVKDLTEAFCRARIDAARPYVYVMVEEVPEGQ